MSEIRWSCWKPRFPFGPPSPMGECVAPDAEAAIRIFAEKLKRPVADFSRTFPEWQREKRAFWVQSHASRRLQEEGAR